MNIWLINPYDELPREGPEQRYAKIAAELMGRCAQEIGDRRWETGEERSSAVPAVKSSSVIWISSSFRHRERTEFAGDRSCLPELSLINSLPGELSELLCKAGAGVNYDFGDAASLFEALKGYAENSLRLKSSSIAASGLFEASFDRDKIYPAFAEWIMEQGRPRPWP